MLFRSARWTLAKSWVVALLQRIAAHVVLGRAQAHNWTVSYRARSSCLEASTPEWLDRCEEPTVSGVLKTGPRSFLQTFPDCYLLPRNPATYLSHDARTVLPYLVGGPLMTATVYGPGESVISLPNVV